jgi:aldehyde dehydrogenase (NAD+)
MVAWKWGPALAAGCTIVMKPAEQTPLTCLRLARLAQKAGIPDGVINVVPGYGPTAGAALVNHPGIDKIAFTGSGETARIIMRQAATSLKRLTFELGGKSPNIVFADADLDAAVAGAHVGIHLNQGQCCCAGSRLFVEDSIHDAFVERVVELSRKRRVGDPFHPDTEQGPQVDKAQFDKILGYIDAGKREGATCATGGKRHGTKGFFIEPTVFTNVSDSMSIAREEIFGPVLSVLRFKDTDELVRRANATDFRADTGNHCPPPAPAMATRSGACSSTTCALVPPIPNELTPARRRPPATGHGTVCAFTKNGVAPKRKLFANV